MVMGKSGVNISEEQVNKIIESKANVIPSKHSISSLH